MGKWFFIMKVADSIVEQWFDFGIVRITDRLDVYPTLAFVGVSRLYKVVRYDLGLHDWFSYRYKTGKVFRISGSLQ